MNLIVDGNIVRTATGHNTESGGGENLAPACWDLCEFADKTAVIEIADNCKGA